LKARFRRIWGRDLDSDADGLYARDYNDVEDLYIRSLYDTTDDLEARELGYDLDELD